MMASKPWRSAQRRYMRKQHLGPILAFCSARARVDGDDRVARIVLAGKQHPGFQLFKRSSERLHLALEFGR